MIIYIHIIYIRIWVYITSAQAIAHHSPADAQPAPWGAEESEMNFQPLQNSFCMSYGMEYPFDQFKSAVLIAFPPGSLGPSLRMALALSNTA